MQSDGVTEARNVFGRIREPKIQTSDDEGLVRYGAHFEGLTAYELEELLASIRFSNKRKEKIQEANAKTVNFGDYTGRRGK